MASVILSTVGASVGGAIGGPIGAAVGQAVGSYVGAQIDSALLGGNGKNIPAPSYDPLTAQRYLEGQPIPRVYGRFRLAGQLIWGLPIRTEYSEENPGGGKGPQPKASKLTRQRFANFAIAFCEGEIAGIGQIWVNGEPVNQTQIQFRLYRGTNEQLPDSTISAHQSGAAPAYRGIAYIVFDELEIEQFGSSILPNIEVEIIRPVDSLEENLSAVTVIPGASEFAYHPTEVVNIKSAGIETTENRHSHNGQSDWAASMDMLDAVCPNVEYVSLVVSWFGTNLDISQCQIIPGVEASDKTTEGAEWIVSGISREQAHVVSQSEGRPAYGGTPADVSVIAAIQDLKSRGKKILLYPFLMMDIPDNNSFVDPYGAAQQAAYPWRGRMTCSIAPGLSGSQYGTSQISQDVDQLFGNAVANDFAIAQNNEIAFVGSNEDAATISRMILHYAHLASVAGGVDAFLIGSEMVGLTHLKNNLDEFPAASKYAELADKVRAIVGSNTKISYAADWTEYGSNTGADAGENNALYFPLDALWASPNIDFVGIDYYAPLSDWRDGVSHLDAQEYSSITDLDYLKSNILGGEGFDWYYQTSADRDAQSRSIISDGAYDKPWVYRVKDLPNWWRHDHFERLEGVERQNPTAWVAQSKPIWLTEIGIPAVTFGTNQPNLFPDPKSSESAVPYFSDGTRDDGIQRAGIKAILEFWEEGDAEINPVSPIYNDVMLDAKTIFLWSWDARPYPYFPLLSNVWGDGANWRTGHWLNGRLGNGDLQGIVAYLSTEYGLENFDVSDLSGKLTGYVLDRPMSLREAVQPLGQAYSFNGISKVDSYIFQHNKNADKTTVQEDHLVLNASEPIIRWQSNNDREIPNALQLNTYDPDFEFNKRSYRSVTPIDNAENLVSATLSAAVPSDQSIAISDQWLQSLWMQKYEISFSLDSSGYLMEIGDLFTVESDNDTLCYQVISLEYADVVKVSAKSQLIDIPVSSIDVSDEDISSFNFSALQQNVKPEMLLLELPQLGRSENNLALYCSLFSQPWNGPYNLYQISPSDELDIIADFRAPSNSGKTLNSFIEKNFHRINKEGYIDIYLNSGEVESISTEKFLSNGNQLAIEHENGLEIIQFQNAELIAEKTYRLSNIIRGARGTEALAAQSIEPDTQFIILNNRLEIFELTKSDIGTTIGFGAAQYGIWPTDRAFQSAQFDVNGVSYAQWRPCHVSASRTDDNDISISFQNRPSFGLDSWEILDIPNEDGFLNYSVSIFDGSALKRELITIDKNVIYPNQEIILDFGNIPVELDIRIVVKNAYSLIENVFFDKVSVA